MIFHTTFEQDALLEKNLYDFSHNIRVKFHFEKNLYVFSYKFRQSAFSTQTGPNQNRLGQFR